MRLRAPTSTGKVIHDDCHRPVPTRQAAVVSARDINKTYGGVTALTDVSLELLPGEVHCLAGENGCGKSTLIKIISGAERPDSGEIIIDGVSYDHDERRPRPSSSGIQVIYQDFSLFPNLTVGREHRANRRGRHRRRPYSPSARTAAARRSWRSSGLDLDLDARGRRPHCRRQAAHRDLPGPRPRRPRRSSWTSRPPRSPTPRWAGCSGWWSGCGPGASPSSSSRTTRRGARDLPAADHHALGPARDHRPRPPTSTSARSRTT